MNLAIDYRSKRVEQAGRDTPVLPVPAWVHSARWIAEGRTRRRVLLFVKQLVDTGMALLLLLLSAPLFLLLALGIMLTSWGNPFFRQQRRGLRFRSFGLIKFRSMSVRAHEKRAELYGANEVDGILFKMHHDPRITPFGAWLRRWDLDELPQLLNVISGRMSLVGPRPFSVEVFQRPVSKTKLYRRWLKERHHLRPGMTGLWQVCGRNKLSFDAVMNLDLYYVRHWSPLLDIWILFRTLPVVAFQYGSLQQSPRLQAIWHRVFGRSGDSAVRPVDTQKADTSGPRMLL